MEVLAEEPIDSVERIKDYITAVSQANKLNDSNLSLIARSTKYLILLFDTWSRHIASTKGASQHAEIMVSLRRSCSRLKLWSNGYGIADGGADIVFAESLLARRATLRVLRSISNIILGRMYSPRQVLLQPQSPT